MNKGKFTVDNLTILYALRYALTRIGPAHQIVRDDIFSNIELFTTSQLIKFSDEIKAEVSSQAFRDDLNKNSWERFLRDIEREIRLRKEIEDMYNK